MLALPLLLAVAAFGQTTSNDAADSPKQIPIPPRVLFRLEKQFPAPSQQETLDFYRRHGGHFVLELDTRCLQSPEKGAEYFAELEQRLARLRQARHRSDEDYRHLLDLLHGQNDCIGLARQIRHIRQTIEERGHPGELANRQAYLERQLTERLEDVFAMVQQHHLVELRRLQSEILDLKRLIDKRSASRDPIIKQQFEDLVDQ